MIAHVLADPREIDPRLDTQRIQLRRRPDAGQHEQLWRADRPGRQDDLFGLDHLTLSVTDELDAARALPLEAQRGYVRVADDPQVRPRPIGDQIAHGGAVADAVVVVDRNRADAPDIRPIHVWTIAVAELGARRVERLAEREPLRSWCATHGNGPVTAVAGL